MFRPGDSKSDWTKERGRAGEVLCDEEEQCSASVHEYLDTCFPAGQPEPEKPGSDPGPDKGPGPEPPSQQLQSSAIPPLSSQTHFLCTWTLSQALVLGGRQGVQSASSPEKTPPKHTQSPPPLSSSTPELFSPATPSPGGSAELFSHTCPTRAEEGGVVLQATTDGVLFSQESSTTHGSPMKSPTCKRARVSEDLRTEEPECTTNAGVQSPTTTLDRCDRAGLRYSVLVVVVHPCHLKEVKVSPEGSVI